MQQRLAGLVDGVDIGALLRLRIAFQKQPRHAEHAVHRRADFVTHGGEEAGLGAVGRFGLVARFGKRVFQRFALGDVAADALHFDKPALRVAHRVIFPGDPAPAIGRAHMLVVAHARLAVLDAAERTEHRRAAVRMQFRREGLAERGLRRQPEQFEEGFVAVCQPAVGPAAKDGVALRIDEALVAVLALMQPPVHGAHRGEGGFKLVGQPVELGGAAFQHAGPPMRADDAAEKNDEADTRHGGEQDGGKEGQLSMHGDVGIGEAAQREQSQSVNDQGQACQPHETPRKLSEKPSICALSRLRKA